MKAGSRCREVGGEGEDIRYTVHISGHLTCEVLFGYEIGAMKIIRLEKELLGPWMDELSTRVDLFVPTKAGAKTHRLEPYAGVDRMDMGYIRTILPPKKFLVPPNETLWKRRAGEDYEVPEIPDRDIVLFGLHPCDIHGVKILDIFFRSFAKPDWYYQRRRERVRIVGLSCMPDDYCFCQSMNTDNVATGFDLFLHDLGDRFLVTVGSVEGDMLLGHLADDLPQADPKDLHDLMDYLEKRNRAFSMHLDVGILPQAMELHRTSPVWERLGNQCLSCGCCSLGCPTCSCFNVVDRNDLEGGCERCRTWDACLFKDFAQVAGGHNFRSQRAARIQNRYYHKQVGFAEQFGLPSCVGCGRCIFMCPTGVHFVEVFRSLREGA